MCRIPEITTTSGCSYCALDGRNNDTPYAEGAKRETMLASGSLERVGNVSELLKLAAASVEMAAKTTPLSHQRLPKLHTSLLIRAPWLPYTCLATPSACRRFVLLFLHASFCHRDPLLDRVEAHLSCPRFLPLFVANRRVRTVCSLYPLPREEPPFAGIRHPSCLRLWL
jgi:hypothetical protein